jgi:hypothetical protein
VNRNAKALQKKAKKNQVRIGANRAEFIVTSATSGNEYTVKALANGGFACCCDWAKWHDTSARPCSHVLAVIEWLEQAGNRSTSIWATPEDAKRQHRHIERVGLGLWVTSRRMA